MEQEAGFSDGVDLFGNHTLIESVKRSVITALRTTFDTSRGLPRELEEVKGNINMEYPSTVESYPGIWVQFSFSSLRRASLQPYHIDKKTGGYYMLGSFEGTVTLNILALSSLARDRIAGQFVKSFLLSSGDSRDEDFFTALRENPYIWISVNQDQLNPGGQSTTIGAPWDADEVVSEDSYSFQIQGQFASDVKTQNLIKLKAIEFEGRLVEKFDHEMESGLDPQVHTIPPGTWV